MTAFVVKWVAIGIVLSFTLAFMNKDFAKSDPAFLFWNIFVWPVTLLYLAVDYLGHLRDRRRQR